VRLQVSDIVGVVGASVRGEVLAGAEVVDLVFDARKLWGLEPSGAMFLALKGRRDGHDFVGQAYAAGVRYFLVSRYEAVWEGLYAGAVFLVVEDVLVALQLMASWHRGRLSGVVMGITGSNGKTIVKEWLWELLKDDFTVGKSPRSYNSGLGVALSLLNVAAGTEVALLEAGISARGEMDVLGGMMRPNMVVLTHLGEAHAEGFGSLEEKAQEKVKLAAGADVVVYPYDQGLLRSALGALRAQQPMMKLISWGWQEGANFRLVKVEAVGSMQAISFVYRGTEHRFEIPFMDQASVSNAMSCLCALVALERWDEAHLARFRVLPRLENRLQFMAGRNGNYVLNDSYSADLESLGVALDMLKRQSPNLPMSVVLGGFEQTGMEVGALRMRLMEVVKGFGVEEVIWVGREYVGMEGLVFEDMEGLLGSAWLGGVSGRAILVKGSRSSGLERVVSRLQARLLQTRLEIHLGALKHNFLHFKRLAGEGKKVMCMVKAFGYGSGSFESARALQALAVDYLGVAYIDEGIALRNAGITVPIMVMNVDSGAAWQLQEYGLEPVVYSFQSLEGLIRSGVQGLKIHIEIDTGMHRFGFAPGDMGELGIRIRDLSVDIEVASVFSHLAASESAGSDDFTQGQLDVFASAADVLEQGLGYTVLKHIENTGGILRFADARFTMVRLGIGLYGVDPRGVIEAALQPVTRWVSTISQVQFVKAGEGVGYGMHGVSDRDREVAVIAAGYADGLWRADGQANSGVWIKGVEAPFVGNICMDMAMVDVTGLNCKPGDEVELFGENLRVETLAQRRSTIPYEVLTAVSQRVARVYVEE